MDSATSTTPIVFAQTIVEAPKYGASRRTAAISAPSEPVPTTKTRTDSGGATDCVRRGEAWPSTAHVYHCAAHLQELRLLLARAGVLRGLSCGSSPERFGVLVRAAGRSPGLRPTVGGRCPTARSPSRRTGSSPIGGISRKRGHGERPGSSAGGSARAPIVRASTSAARVGDLVVAERHVHQHRVRRRVRQRVGRHVLRVAVGLAAVPEQLDHANSSGRSSSFG